MIVHILERRFPPSETLLTPLSQQLAQISDETVLNQLVDIALEVIVLPDFINRVGAFVPPSA